MKEVWTVLCAEKYEGSTLEGIFSTEQKANEYKTRMDKDNPLGRCFELIVAQEQVDVLCKEEASDDWPEDENHRLGPNGERLIAVAFQSCSKCVLFEEPCYSNKEVLRCHGGYRKDGRNIHWELAGDRK